MSEDSAVDGHGRAISHDPSEWEFSEGDVVREKYGHTALGGVEVGKSEYRIKWRLVRPSNEKRCYLVEKEEGGTHLYTASVVEGQYEVIELSESREFEEQDDDSGGVEW